MRSCAAEVKEEEEEEDEEEVEMPSKIPLADTAVWDEEEEEDEEDEDEEDDEDDEVSKSASSSRFDFDASIAFFWIVISGLFVVNYHPLIGEVFDQLLSDEFVAYFRI